MIKTNRPHGTSRPPGSGPVRPGNSRGRPTTGKASKSSKVDSAHLHDDEPEIDGEEPSLQGEDYRDTLAENLSKLKEGYRKDSQNFESEPEGDGSHGGKKGSPEALIPGPNTPRARKPALEAQPQQSAPSAPASAAPTASAYPLMTTGAQRTAQVAPPRSPAPTAETSSAPMRSSSRRPDARTLLSTGKPVGTLLSELSTDNPTSSTLLTGAVAELQQHVKGMKGIGRVAAGNHKGEVVVFVEAHRGRLKDLLSALPDKIHDFGVVLKYLVEPSKPPSGGST